MERVDGGELFSLDGESYYFCELGMHAKFQNPMVTPSGKKVTFRREIDKNRKTMLKWPICSVFNAQEQHKHFNFSVKSCDHSFQVQVEDTFGLGRCILKN